MPVSPSAGDDPPLKPLAIAYGIRKQGWDQLAGVSAAIQRELPVTAWDDLPANLSGRAIVTPLAKNNAISQVIGTMVVNIDPESFALFQPGLLLEDRLRSSIEGMVEAAAFREGGAAAFVDIVLDNMSSHLAGDDD